MAIPRFGAVASSDGRERWVWKVGWKGDRASKTLKPGCPWKWEQKVENEELRGSQAEVSERLPALGKRAEKLQQAVSGSLFNLI